MDPKRIVEDGYNQIAERYAAWAGVTGVEVQDRYLAVVVAALPPGAAVLELGCGSGGRVTQALAARFQLTGVDISARSIELARRNVPGAEFIHHDMTTLDFAPATWDAVVAFYSILHVPRAEHAALFARMAAWLRPGGLVVASFGTLDSEAGYEADWLGTPMYWSGYVPEVELGLLRNAGLAIERSAIETIDEDGVPTPFLWVVARKPHDADTGLT